MTSERTDEVGACDAKKRKGLALVEGIHEGRSGGTGSNIAVLHAECTPESRLQVFRRQLRSLIDSTLEIQLLASNDTHAELLDIVYAVVEEATDQSAKRAGVAWADRSIAICAEDALSELHEGRLASPGMEESLP